MKYVYGSPELALCRNSLRMPQPCRRWLLFLRTTCCARSSLHYLCSPRTCCLGRRFTPRSLSDRLCTLPHRHRTCICFDLFLQRRTHSPRHSVCALLQACSHFALSAGCAARAYVALRRARVPRAVRRRAPPLFLRTFFFLYYIYEEQRNGSYNNAINIIAYQHGRMTEAIRLRRAAHII